MKKLIMSILFICLLIPICVFAQGKGATDESTEKVVSETKETKVKKEKEEKSDQFIVINKYVNKLAFYEKGKRIKIYGVATGATSKLTPEGEFKVIVKWECPAYYKTKTPGCAPGNPLGNRWMGLSVPGTEGYTYGIHGTNAEWSIGTHASHGCVRMINRQVERLFEIVKKNTPVVIINEDKEFDQVAEEHGYKVEKPIPLNKEITLLKEVELHDGPHGKLATGSKIDSKSITVTQQSGKWMVTEVNGTPYWIHPTEYVEGALKQEEQFVFVSKNKRFYAAPNEKKQQIVMNQSKVYKTTEHTDNWYHIVLEDGVNFWIPKKTITKQVTQEDFTQQEQLLTTLQQLLFSSTTHHTL